MDLLLDRTPAASGSGDGNGHAFFASTEPSIGARVAKAQQVLQLLEALGDVEPPSDLLGRTLKFVEDSRHRQGVIGAEVPNFAGSRPSA